MTEVEHLKNQIAKLESEIQDINSILEYKKHQLDKIKKDNEQLLKRHDELQTIKIASSLYCRDRFLNNEEFKIYRHLLRLMDMSKVNLATQVALSAFLSTGINKELWYIYNTYYVDFLLLNRTTTRPICVIEYFGGGHGDDINTKMRDEIKRQIFEKVQLPYVIITDISNIDDANLMSHIKKAMDKVFNY